MRSVVRRLSLVGFALSFALVVAFVTSLRWVYGYTGSPIFNHDWAPSGVAGGNGAIGVFFSSSLPPGPSGFWFWGNNYGEHLWPWWQWHPTLEFEGPVVASLAVPMWIPFVLIAVPSFIAWRVTRHLPGHCRKCQYDLTGNVSGVCPECGSKTGQHVSIGG